MKLNFSIAILIALTVLSSCNQKEIDQLNQQKIDLEATAQARESQINKMLASFNTIQGNLQEIKSREGIINIVAEEGQVSDIGQEINNDIELISQLMQENETLVGTLNQQLKNSDLKMVEFRKLISGLNERISDKNKEIGLLNKKLQEKKILIGQLYFKNDSLTYLNQMKEAEMNEQIDAMNIGYFAYGTYKELKEKNVLTKEGGFLGLGKNEELKDDFNKEYFSKIDIRKQKSLLIYAKKAELITTHPKSSYEFMGADNKVDSLVIKDADAFWNASKYLVIVVD